MTTFQTSVAEPIDQRQSHPQATPPKRGRVLSPVQRLVLAAAALPLVGIAATATAGALGLISVNRMVDVSLALGEEPGMAVFAAMLWCTPVQWLVKRTQVPVRKWLGILFSGYAVANFVMFVVEEGVADSLSRPFLIAGTIAMLAAIPLLLTSGRRAQRTMGMRNWRTLHKLTYLIALALVVHVVLIGEFTFFAMLIVVGMIARVPPIAKSIPGLGQHLRN